MFPCFRYVRLTVVGRWVGLRVRVGKSPLPIRHPASCTCTCARSALRSCQKSAKPLTGPHRPSQLSHHHRYRPALDLEKDCDRATAALLDPYVEKCVAKCWVFFRSFTNCLSQGRLCQLPSCSAPAVEAALTLQRLEHREKRGQVNSWYPVSNLCNQPERLRSREESSSCSS